MPKEYTGDVAAVVLSKEDSEAYLIAKRSDNREWEFPGGKQHADETLLEAAEREIREELGFEVEAVEASKNFSYESGGYNIVPVYAEPEKDFSISLKEHLEYRWIVPEELSEDMRKELGEEILCLEAFDLL